MKRMLIAVLVLAVLWSGYWVVGAYGARQAFVQWFDDRRADGWVAEYTDFSLRGFPNRFDATWQDLSLADPETGVAVNLPMFQILALSYQPHQIIAVWPDEMLVSTPYAKLPVTNEDLRASLHLRPGLDLPLNQANVSAQDLTIGTGEGRVAVAALDMAVQRQGDAPTYRLGLRGNGVAAPELRRAGSGSGLPERMEEIHVDATVTFDRPWDRSALEDSRPQPRQINLTAARAKWGALALQAAGTLEVDAEGRPEGELSVQARNWRDMLQMAVAAGALPASMAGTAEQALSFVAGMSGNPNSIDATLTFTRGLVMLGPLPIGPAPGIRLR